MMQMDATAGLCEKAQSKAACIHLHTQNSSAMPVQLLELTASTSPSDRCEACLAVIDGRSTGCTHLGLSPRVLRYLLLMLAISCDWYSRLGRGECQNSESDLSILSGHSLAVLFQVDWDFEGE